MSEFPHDLIERCAIEASRARVTASDLGKPELTVADINRAITLAVLRASDRKALVAALRAISSDNWSTHRRLREIARTALKAAGEP